MSATRGIALSGDQPPRFDFLPDGSQVKEHSFGNVFQGNSRTVFPTAWNPERTARLIESHRKEQNDDLQQIAPERASPASTETGDVEEDESDRDFSSRETSGVESDDYDDHVESGADTEEVESEDEDGFGVISRELIETEADYDGSVANKSGRSTSLLDRRIEEISEEFMKRYDFTVMVK